MPENISQKEISIEDAADALHSMVIPDSITDQLYGLLLEYKETGDCEIKAKLLDAIDALDFDYAVVPFRSEVQKL